MNLIRLRQSLLLALCVLALPIHAGAQSSGSGGSSPGTEQFAALAFSDETRAYGYSYNQPNRKTADEVALAECSKHASDCKIEMWTNRCLSLARADDGSWGTHWKENKQDAVAAAMKICSQHSNTCKTVVAVCNGDR